MVSRSCWCTSSGPFCTMMGSSGRRSRLQLPQERRWLADPDEDVEFEVTSLRVGSILHPAVLVCIENLSTAIVVMKSAQDGA